MPSLEIQTQFYSSFKSQKAMSIMFCLNTVLMSSKVAVFIAPKLILSIFLQFTLWSIESVRKRNFGSTM